MEPQQAEAPAPQVPMPTSGVPTPGVPNNAPGGMPPTFSPVSAPSGKSKTGLILGIIGGVVGLVIVLSVAAYLFLGSNAASAAVANKFQKEMSAGNPAGAALLMSDGQSADTKAYLAAASAAVKGSYRASDTTFKDGKRYSLYTLDNATNKYARVIVEKQSGQWLVASYVYGQSKLALIPGTTASTTAQTSTRPATTTPTTTAACLTVVDYNAITQAIDGDNNTIAWSADDPFTQNVHFNADSLQYDNDGIENGIVNGFVAFYKANPSKVFTIHLQGSVGTTAQADLNFANQRAQKVQAQLEAGGVPASYTAVDAPQNVGSFSSDTSNSTDKQTARSVVLTIIPGACSVAASTTGK